MPADNLDDAARRDNVLYPLWVKQGLIEATPGRAIDKRFVVERGELTKEFNVEFARPIAGGWMRSSD
jgi:hypothetical protein